MSPERKSLVAQQEKVLSCPILSPSSHPLLSSSAPLLLLPHSSPHLLSPPPPLPLTSSSSDPSPLLFLLSSPPLPILSSTDRDCDAGDNDGNPCGYDDGDGAGDGNVDAACYALCLRACCTRMYAAWHRVQFVMSGGEILSARGIHSVSMLGELVGNYHHGKSCVRPAKGNLCVMKS